MNGGFEKEGGINHLVNSQNQTVRAGKWAVVWQERRRETNFQKSTARICRTRRTEVFYMVLFQWTLQCSKWMPLGT